MPDFPVPATPAMLDALGQMPWVLQPIAHAMRDAGADIPRKTEVELAHAQFWLLRLAIVHGDTFKKVAGARIQSRDFETI